MNLRLRSRKSEDQQSKKKEAVSASTMPPKKRAGMNLKKNRQQIHESADPLAPEAAIDGLLEQHFPGLEGPVSKAKPNVEEEESESEDSEWEECSTRRKRRKPEAKSKNKKQKRGKKTKDSDRVEEREEAIDATSQHRQIAEEDELPIINDEPETSPLNAEDTSANTKDAEENNRVEDTDAIVNEQVTYTGFNELDSNGVSEFHLQLATQSLSGSSPGASGYEQFGGEDSGSNKPKKMVHFNDKGQPIGEGSTTFASDLGSIARKYCPISYEKWKDVPDQTRDALWKLVTDKYIVPVAYRKNILHKIHDSWKSFKVVIRSKHYDIYDTDEERKKKCPVGIKQEVWNIFVNNESTPLAQARRRAGKLAILSMKTPHTSGRTGAARIAEALKKRNPSANVTRTDLYLATHTRKDGSFPTPELANKVGQIKTIAKENPASVNLDVDHDPVGQVLGPEKKGFIRGMGLGISKTALLHSAPAMDQLQLERKMRLSAEEQINDLRLQVCSQNSGSPIDLLEEEMRLRLAAAKQIVALKQELASRNEQIDDLRQQVTSQLSAPPTDLLDEERRLRLSAEEQIAVLKREIEQLKQGKVSADAKVTELKEQVTSQGALIADLKGLVKRLC